MSLPHREGRKKGSILTSVVEPRPTNGSDASTLHRALAYFMRDIGVIEDDPEPVLDVYFGQCSIEVTSQDLANIGAILANDGVALRTGEQIIPAEVARIGVAGVRLMEDLSNALGLSIF